MIRKHSYRKAGQGTQQNWNCDQKSGLCGGEVKLLAKLRGKCADEALCREANRERYSPKEQMPLL